ncbi:hypothetical protein [Streptomyces sp. NPDC056399]|uniref:hypothetical protein n=1 Tax=Streptomyces sp. NPDC056399 TaxID=3345807 RepID=UPI0035DC2062
MITLGVEEEYLLVDPATAVPTPAVEEVRRAAYLGPFAESAEIQDELLQAPDRGGHARVLEPAVGP